MTTFAGLAEEEQIGTVGTDAWTDLLARISHLSVTRHFDAYADIAWDAPELALDPTDHRWELPGDDPLGGTTWYQALPQPTRARLGVDLTASSMKTGLQFESVLKQGLLQFAAALPNGSPEFRYAYHEIIEEAQHSLMFQEFINRSGFDVDGMGTFNRMVTRFVVRLGRRFPPLFFIFVLGGEDPIDYFQRQELRSGRDLHPLIERIMRIHVTEEARHLSFARHYLKREVPTLGPIRRTILAVGAPLILAGMAQEMLMPSRQVIRRYQIPKGALSEAYKDNAAASAQLHASLRKVRQLCEDLGLLSRGYRRLWKALGLWASTPAPG
jgi:hypothetical protein